MAATTPAATGPATATAGNDPLSKARAVRAANKGKAIDLSDNQKFAVRQCQMASKVAKLVAAKLRLGEDVSPEVVRACGNLATIGGGELFS